MRFASIVSCERKNQNGEWIPADYYYYNPYAPSGAVSLAIKRQQIADKEALVSRLLGGPTGPTGVAPISSPRGYPADATAASLAGDNDDCCCHTFFTLAELITYDRAHPTITRELPETSESLSADVFHSFVSRLEQQARDIGVFGYACSPLTDDQYLARAENFRILIRWVDWYKEGVL